MKIWNLIKGAIQTYSPIDPYNKDYTSEWTGALNDLNSQTPNYSGYQGGVSGSGMGLLLIGGLAAYLMSRKKK